MRINNQKGFTILELMIATAVFTVILLIATFALLQIGRMFYKGVTLSRVQESTRSIMDEITQSIQFSGESVSLTLGPVNKLCIGNTRYSFVEGKMMNDPATTEEVEHALVVDDDATSCANDSARALGQTYTLTGTDRELLQPKMRISDLQVNNLGQGRYEVYLKIANGSNDLLDNHDNPNATCKSLRLGSQFCAVSELRTTVLKRVNVD